jgi:UDP-N-acetylmuramate dehydrogenase
MSKSMILNLCSVERDLALIVDRDRVKIFAPLAKLTTFNVGGNADLLVKVRTAKELVDVLHVAREIDLPVTILGGGSNVLVGDLGVRGLVVLMRGGEIRLTSPDRVLADSGVTINGLIRWTISKGLGGLESWAGTPGTVGGAVAGNAHFEGRLISEVIDHAQVVTQDGKKFDISAKQLEFGYDASRLKSNGEVLLSATFLVHKGDRTKLRATARESLSFRKQSQPLAVPSAGCIFRNPSPDEVPSGLPVSAGALLDDAGLKGKLVGGARVSDTHANFVVNEGGATAQEIRTLVRFCQDVVAKRFGVRLREEIVYVGEFKVEGELGDVDAGS